MRLGRWGTLEADWRSPPEEVCIAEDMGVELMTVKGTQARSSVLP